MDKHKYGDLSAGLHAASLPIITPEEEVFNSRTTSLGEGDEKDYVFVFPKELQIREEGDISAFFHLRYMQLPYDKCKEKGCRAQVNKEPEAKPVRGQYCVPAIKQYWKDENTTTIRELKNKENEHVEEYYVTRWNFMPVDAIPDVTPRAGCL
ncbi:hypothetical protein Bbelb_344030 [Branchiostoma belcheri]|nr:hypothetical protein Bbelb_344030 [Branchiostoma belcheri]